MGSFFSSAVRRRLVRWKMAAAVTEELVKDREFGVLYLEVSILINLWVSIQVSLVCYTQRGSNS